MKFVMSYSCGKDSTLALHRMIKQNHEPVGLLVMCNEKDNRSWFHGVDSELMDKISESLNIPLIKCVSHGEDYNAAFENGLKRAKAMGVQACVFGDIDIEDHKTWGKERCQNVGMDHVFPLWNENREKLTLEFVSSGFQAIIKCINNKLLPMDVLGKELDFSMIQMLKQKGIDVCGENGEYHTVVVGGPLFKEKINVKYNEKIVYGDFSVLDIRAN